MDKVREALDLLEKCAPSHFDFSGALVHHTDSKQDELRFDPCCPKCVIPKAITLIREALASPEAASDTRHEGLTSAPAPQGTCVAGLCRYRDRGDCSRNKNLNVSCNCPCHLEAPAEGKKV